MSLTPIARRNDVFTWGAKNLDFRTIQVKNCTAALLTCGGSACCCVVLRVTHARIGAQVLVVNKDISGVVLPRFSTSACFARTGKHCTCGMSDTVIGCTTQLVKAEHLKIWEN